MLNLTRPDVVRSIHERYLAAGADITTTNTFTATSIGQADYGLEDAVYEMNVAGARIAREAARRPLRRRLGRPAQRHALAQPEGRRPVVPHAHASTRSRTAYAEQIRGLAEGGVDLLLLETIFDTLNAKAAIAAAREAAPELPLWISATIVDLSGPHALRADDRGVLDLGRARRAADRRRSTARSAPREMRPYVAELSRLAPCLVSATRTPACRTRSAATTRRPR